MYLDMKVQLNEETFSLYLNEAIRQELSEGASSIGSKAHGLLQRGAKWLGKLLGKGGDDVTKAIAKNGDDAFKALGKSKGAFHFVDNAERVQTARRAMRAVNDGSGALFKVKGTKGAEGLEYVAKKVKGKDGKYVIDYFDKTGKTRLTGTMRQSARRHFKGYQEMIRKGNLNRLGVAATAGAGAGGYILGRNHGNGSAEDASPDAPWNYDAGDDMGGGSGPGAGGFPWDDVTPRPTPRRPRPSAPAKSEPTKVDEPEQPNPEQPKREPMQPLTPPTNIQVPSLVTPPESGGLRGVTRPGEGPTSLVASTLNNMTGMATASPATASQAEKNAAIRQAERNAVRATRRDDYGPTAKQDRDTIRDYSRTVRRGDQNPGV